MKDRVPRKPGRVELKYDDGTTVQVTMTRKDEPVEEGTRLCKATILPDDVCDILGIDRASSEPKDGYLGVIKALGRSILTIKALQVDGSPLAGFKIEGLTGVLASKTYTDANGGLFLIIPEGTYTLSIPTAQCIDATLPAQTVTIVAGTRQDIIMRMKTTGITEKMFTSSDTVKFSGNVKSLDIFCCGGGGGGGGGTGSSMASLSTGGGGGGGGYTTTQLNKLPIPFQAYPLMIGSGGGGGNVGDFEAGGGLDGGYGGTTSFMGYSISGGRYGEGGGADVNGGGSGGYGGSGGGGGSQSRNQAGNGGSNGGNGVNGTGSRGKGGSGQGSNTYAFGEASGALYAGGGGGGGTTGPTGTAGGGYYGLGGNGGCGDGGTSYARGQKGSSGNSGAVMLRWRNKV